jgi:hypothetical protein
MAVTHEAPVATASARDASARNQAERIIQSRVFRTSDVLRRLFLYLAEKSLVGEADALKEYSIGIDALGKPESFDPRQESVVRMHTARLRQKLAEYYRTDGASDPVIIDIPKGGFRVTFETRSEPQPVPAVAIELPVALPQPRATAFAWTWQTVAATTAVVLLIVAAAGFAGSRLRPEQQTATSAPAAAWTPALRDLWQPLLAPDRRLIVCISTPMFVRVPGFGVVRDSSVNDWGDVPGSKQISSLEGALNSSVSEPSYAYAEAGTATGAFLLGQFLAPRKQNVVVTRANVLSWPEIADSNVVFIGPPSGIHQAEDLPMDAQMMLDNEGVRNLHPRPGEPGVLKDQPARNGEEGGASYALISRVPAMNGDGSILMLSGNQVSSVMGSVQAFTNPALAQMLVSKMKSATGVMPKYFQVVLKIKSMDDVPLETSYVYHRELSGPAHMAQK